MKKLMALMDEKIINANSNCVINNLSKSFSNGISILDEGGVVSTTVTQNDVESILKNI